MVQRRLQTSTQNVSSLTTTGIRMLVGTHVRTLRTVRYRREAMLSTISIQSTAGLDGWARNVGLWGLHAGVCVHRLQT